ADRHLGADQIETLGAQLTENYAPSGKSNFRFWRACDNDSIRIADDDVAQPQRRSALFIAFQLRAADDDCMVAAKVLFDGRLQPWGRQIQFNWPTRKAPP